MRIAICICTCERPAALRECLEAVDRALRAAPPRDAELALVVVDNRPDGRAAAVCDALGANLPCPLRFAEERERGVSFARNRAVSVALAAGAELICFLDDDDIPDPDWLARLVARQRETGAELVFGAWRWPAELALRGWQRDIKFFRAPDLTVTNRFGLPAAAGTFNVAIARTLLERMAPEGPWFRPQFALAGGGDTDFFVRAHRRGASTATAADSHVVRRWDAGRTSLAGVLRRSFRLGNTTALQDRDALDARAFRHKRRRVALRLARRIVATPLHLLPPRRFARHAFEVARLAGDAYGRWLDGRVRYYGARAPSTSDR